MSFFAIRFKTLCNLIQSSLGRWLQPCPAMFQILQITPYGYQSTMSQCKTGLRYKINRSLAVKLIRNKLFINIMFQTVPLIFYFSYKNQIIWNCFAFQYQMRIFSISNECKILLIVVFGFLVWWQIKLRRVQEVIQLKLKQT